MKEQQYRTVTLLYTRNKLGIASRDVDPDPNLLGYAIKIDLLDTDPDPVDES